MLPMMITSAVQASVSVKRINEFMRSDELEPGLVKRSAATADNNHQDAIRVTNGSFRWEAAASAVEKDAANGAVGAAPTVNGAHGAAAEKEGVKEEGEETEKLLLNGSAVGAVSEAGATTPRDIFSLKNINIRWASNGGEN